MEQAIATASGSVTSRGLTSHTWPTGSLRLWLLHKSPQCRCRSINAWSKETSLTRERWSEVRNRVAVHHKADTLDKWSVLDALLRTLIWANSCAALQGARQSVTSHSTPAHSRWSYVKILTVKDFIIHCLYSTKNHDKWHFGDFKD